MCDEIIVMYGGRVCERGTADAIFYSPAHEYTKGLLRSIPFPVCLGLVCRSGAKNMRRAAKAAPCAIILGSKLIHRPIHQPPRPGRQCAEGQHRGRDGKNLSANARYPAFGLELHRRADHLSLIHISAAGPGAVLQCWQRMFCRGWWNGAGGGCSFFPPGR